MRPLGHTGTGEGSPWIKYPGLAGTLQGGSAREPAFVSVGYKEFEALASFSDFSTSIRKWRVIWE